MKRKVLLIAVLFFLMSCTQSDNDKVLKEDVSENIDTTMVNGALLKIESEDKINNLKKTNKKEQENPKTQVKKDLIYGIWTFSKSGSVRGKMKFTKNGEWFEQKKNRNSWKKQGEFKISKDCKYITLSEGSRKGRDYKIDTYGPKKVVIIIDKRDLSDNVILIK